MKQLLALAVGFAVSISAAQAEIAEAEYFNSAAHVSGLVHTEREPRAKKFFYLMPGRIKFYHYEWVMPDGSKRVKVEEQKRVGVQDMRPLKESNPNLAFGLPVLQQLWLATLNVVTAVK